MSTQFTTSESRPPVTSSAIDPDTQPSTGHIVTQEPPRNPGSIQPVGAFDLPMPSTCHLAPFDERLNGLLETPRWQKDLDDYFTRIFTPSVLSDLRQMEDIALRTLQIITIDDPTQRAQGLKTRGLALVVCTHWMRMQCRCKNANVCAEEIVALVSRIANYPGRISTHARMDFLNELGYVCVERLKLTWRWYVALVTRGVLPIHRKNLFMRVMTVVAMIAYLFHGGQLQYGAVLDCLGCIATMSPWPDALAVIYAFLHKLGPNFALEQAGWHFVRRLLAELFPLTVGRVHVDPLCQLVSAINTLVAEWHNSTQVTLYHTSSSENNQFHAY
ncbi:hypothetical protein EV363DRAFT_1211811, partial [Boletus edulis]